jgi:uncharacterized protein (DUF2461 family)
VRDVKRFREVWGLGGESLKRAPRGYDEEHPMVEDLRRTDHIAFCEFPDKIVVDPKLIETVAGRYRQAANYLRWQARALDIAF